MNSGAHLDQRIAIIGMAGRFPGAADVDRFWQNIERGVESIAALSDEQLLAAGVDRDLLARADYVKAAALLDDIEQFDAAFFGYSPREAATIDPQQRIFLETAWEALEDAGCADVPRWNSIGVFAAAGGVMSSYLLCDDRTRCRLVGPTAGVEHVGNDKDFLSTRVSYKLNLRGPSLTVQTACSSSLVAVHLACGSLLSGQCDLALAGGVTVRVPQQAGYRHTDLVLLSPDGHCRPLDADARGTVFGSGVGIVVLKRWAEAVADGDRIDAIIRGSAVNNDGGDKLSYWASSVEGQAAAMVEALGVAEVDPRTIGYVEAHAAGTKLGDPLEIMALCRAFRTATTDTGFCAVGSVKGNIGLLEAGAGVAGLIKTVAALKHKTLPQSVNFRRPNPAIDFANSPFFVPRESRPWAQTGSPRRAAVNSLGIGGTNAHLILEEAVDPPRNPGAPERPLHVLTLSAKTAAALRAQADRFAAHLARHPEQSFGDVCYTANTGRAHFAHRLALLAASGEEARSRLLAFANGQAEAIADFPEPGAEERPRLEKLCAAYLAGAAVDWREFDRHYARRKVALPTYPFQRQRYWIEGPPPAARGKMATGHPLLGMRLNTAGREIQFESHLRAASLDCLGAQPGSGPVVFPVEGYMEMALAAGRQVLGCPTPMVEHLTVERELSLPEDRTVLVQSILTPQSEGSYTFEVFHFQQADGPGKARWVRHARGNISAGE